MKQTYNIILLVLILALFSPGFGPFRLLLKLTPQKWYIFMKNLNAQNSLKRKINIENLSLYSGPTSGEGGGVRWLVQRTNFSHFFFWEASLSVNICFLYEEMFSSKVLDWEGLRPKNYYAQESPQKNLGRKNLPTISRMRGVWERSKSQARSNQFCKSCFILYIF